MAGVGQHPQSNEFAVALSGGGNRASLLALGSILALIDRGLASRIRVISSVSGGSITNAVLAYRCDVGRLGPGEFDGTAMKLVSRMSRRVLISAGQFLLIWLVFSAAAVGIVNLLGINRWWVDVVAAVIVAALILMLTGQLLRSALNVVYFNARTPPTLSTIAGRTADHIFCATDLVTGLPIMFSSRDSMACRRIPTTGGTPNIGDVDSHQKVDYWSLPKAQLAAVVRASAAFPGIAPMKIRFRDRDYTTAPTAGSPSALGVLPRVAFCSDGGVWNNLATQSIREDGGRSAISVLCVNASATPRPARTRFAFNIPGVALVVALLRIVKVLNRNTVEPRIESIDRDLVRRAQDHTSPTQGDPLTIVSGMAPVSSYRQALERLVRIAECSSGRGPIPPVSVLPGQLDTLVSSEWWMNLEGADDSTPIVAPTNLGRIKHEEVRRLVLRGYANTWLASLFLEPHSASDLTPAPVTNAVERLEAIVGAGPSA